MVSNSIDSPKERKDRYDDANSRMNSWRASLHEAYSYSADTRASFYNQTKGRTKNLVSYDGTATESLRKFANNIQSTLMPPFQNFAKIIPGPEAIERIDKSQLEQLSKELEKITESVFHYINKSNFSMIVSEALIDMGISTGVMMINQIDDDMPINFTAVPINEVALESGPNGSIENVWRTREMPIRLIKRYWPNATLTHEMNLTLETNPNSLVKVIEGTVYYPNNDDNHKYHYDVRTESDNKEIFSKFMNFSPWIAFRMNRSTGEVLGTGPILEVMPQIRLVNKMTEFELRGAKLKALPIYMASDTGAMNGYNIRMEPGAIVPLKMNNGKFPLEVLPNSGDPRFMQLNIQQIQSRIREALFSDPLGPVDNTMQSKVEISIRQNNWLRQNAVSIGRLTVELLEPVITKIIKILGMRGLIQIPEIDGKLIAVEYQSPLTNIQNESELESLEKYIQFCQSTMGPESIPMSTNIKMLPGYVSEKLGVSSELIPTESEIEQMMKQAANIAQQQAESQQEPQQ